MCTNSFACYIMLILPPICIWSSIRSAQFNRKRLEYIDFRKFQRHTRGIQGVSGNFLSTPGGSSFGGTPEV